MPRISQTFRALSLATLLVTSALPANAQEVNGLTGAYLAARVADSAGDFREVISYGSRALAKDPENTRIMEGILIAHIGLGELDKALPVARRLGEMDENSELASLVLLGNAMGDERWQEVREIIEGGFTVGGLLDPLILAWSAIGEGQMSRALEIFDDLADDSVARQVSAFQKAQALAYVGDFEGAAEILSGNEVDLALNRSGTLAYAQILSQLERNQDAVAMLDATFGDRGDEEIVTLRAELAAGKPIPFTAIRSPKDGLSGLFFSVGEALAGEASPSLVLIYARVAQHLNPDNIGATLLIANIFELIRNYELAVETYDQIGEDSLAFPQAMLGKATALRQLERNDAAIETLRDLAKDYPDLAPVHIALGDEYRYEELWDESAAAYSAAIDLFEEDNSAQWATYFSRGIANERRGEWPMAEADFLKALELQPDQPSVLNYLGYSYVEKRQNLDTALDMIRKAVAERPNEGYIVDSLGWVYYRLGRYDEAVVQMEKAVQLMAVDPVVNDHLGDVYWAVGRVREAEFQWERALSFITDDTDLDEVKPDRIRRKLEVGLDQVLEEEGGDPINYEGRNAAN